MPEIYGTGEGEQDWIETFTGRRFKPMSPDPKQLTIYDMAHAVSLMCRYNGHLACFYSSGEHALNLAVTAERVGLPEDVQLEFLVHDFTDAYFPDVCRPIKHFFPELVAAEKHLYQLIREHAGLSGPIPRIVKEWDSRIINDERRSMMLPSNNVWAVQDMPPLGIEPNSHMPPWRIENALIAQWAKLTKATHGKTTFVDFTVSQPTERDLRPDAMTVTLPHTLKDVCSADLLGQCSLWYGRTFNLDGTTEVTKWFDHGAVSGWGQ